MIERRVRGPLPALAAAAAVASVGAAQGGYFPAAWGWSGLAFSWLGGVALLVRSRLVLSRLELVFLAALAGLTAWSAVSIVWSSSVSLSVSEVERDAVYLSAALALVACLHGRLVGKLLGGLLAGLTGICAYALATRLFPDRLGTADIVQLAGNRLFQPVGYWNALGMLAALGAVLAVGITVTMRGTAVRAAASASLVVLVPTLYFTFSRGAWLALAVGLAASGAAVGRHRLRFALTALALAPAPAIALLLSSKSSALTHREASPGQAAHDGHRLALAVLVLALAAAAIGAGLRLLETRLPLGVRARRLCAAGLVATALASGGAALAVNGGPVDVARHAYDSFVAPSPQKPDLNQRLLQLSDSGRSDLWGVAWGDVEAHPALGSGAGTFERYWYEHRVTRRDVRDAHNLYLETLAELGPVGLALLLVALAAPLAAAARARARPLVAPALGAYAAYLVHAAFDWDWEMPVVTLAGLACGAALMVAARPAGAGVAARRTKASLVGIAVALGGFAFVVLVGSGAASASVDALRRFDWAAASRQAQKAADWTPWSAEPWRLLAQARLGAGDTAGAAAALRLAVAADSGDYRLWLALSYVTEGHEQQRARMEASALDPLLLQELARR